MPDWIYWLFDSGFAVSIAGLCWWSYKVGVRVGEMKKTVDNIEKRLDDQAKKIDDLGDLKIKISQMSEKIDNVCNDVSFLRSEGSLTRETIASLNANVKILLKRENLS